MLSEKFFDGAGCPANAKVSSSLCFFYKSAYLRSILGVKKQVENQAVHACHLK